MSEIGDDQIQRSHRHTQEPMHLGPHIQQSSVDAKVKSPIKKGTPEVSDKSIHHLVPHSKMNHKHTQKHVHSLSHPITSRELEFPIKKREKSESYDRVFFHAPRPLSSHPQLCVSQRDTRSIIEESSAGSINMLHSFSLADNKFSKQPDHGSCPQLYVPAVPVYREIATATKNDTDLVKKNSIMEFSLHYDVRQSKLRVRLLNASDLPLELHRGSPVQCDPFVVLHLEPNREDTFQSQIMKRTHNPRFNRSFHFGGFSKDSIRHQTLVLRIYNHASNNKTIGKVYLPLRDAELFGTAVQMKIVHTDKMEVYYTICTYDYLHQSLDLYRVTTKAIYTFHSAIVQYHALWLAQSVKPLD